MLPTKLAATFFGGQENSRKCRRFGLVGALPVSSFLINTSPTVTEFRAQIRGGQVRSCSESTTSGNSAFKEASKTTSTKRGPSSRMSSSCRRNWQASPNPPRLSPREPSRKVPKARRVTWKPPGNVPRKFPSATSKLSRARNHRLKWSST